MFKMTCSQCNEWYWVGNGCACWNKPKQQEKPINTRAYNAWRRAESFQIPVTEEGLQQAEQRHQWFLRGFEAGVRCAAEHLEFKHKEVKDTTRAHNFYLVASRFVRELYQEETT